MSRRKQSRAPLIKGGAEVSEHRLRNGLRVLVAERHADPIVAVLLFYRAGSRNETERESGISHFLEHMMFKGSRAFGKGEVDRCTAAMGGSNNAYTGYDHTAYWFEFASDRWETALQLEADRMRRLTLDPSEFAAEREVVLEELAMGADDPWRVLTEIAEGVLFPQHPYGRPILGYEDTLRNLTVDDMRDYYDRFYHPSNATLVVCGDVRPDGVVRSARKHFGAIPAGGSYEEADCFRMTAQMPAGQARIKTSWDDAGKRLCAAWRTVSVATDDDYALDLVLSVLASGRTSRLQRRLVHEEALATSVSASNDTRVEGGAFWLFLECAPETEPEVLERALEEELERIRSTPISQAEFKRAKALLRSSEAFDRESVSDVAEELGEWAVDADWRLAFDQCARHDEFTPAQLRDVAARLLVPEHSVIVWSLPQE